MHLRYTILYVESVGAMLSFYERAFGLSRRFLHESGTYGELETGGTRLAFSSRELMRELGKAPGRPDAKAPVFEIAFETDDVPTAFERAVREGAVAIQGPEQMPWGQTTAYVTDPEGFLVEICSPVA